MADSPTTIHPFPELRQLAEREAQARADARARYGYTSDTGGASWAAMAPASRDIAVSVEIALLCDLTRDASRHAVARLVAVKMERPALDILWGVETSGAVRSGLLRDAGCSDGWPSSPAEALATLVRHLWPQE